MLIFALNFLKAIVFIYHAEKSGKKETHEYTSCQVRGFLIIP